MVTKIIPENFTEFLHWFKTVTEESWAEDFEIEGKSFAVAPARWIGMSESEITFIESKYELQFPADFREFLKVLHTTVGWSARSFYSFFNWFDEEEIVVKKLNWPRRELKRDGYWSNSWGKREESSENYAEVFDRHFDLAPKAIPIYSHRFYICNTVDTANPVLSVWGTDTIVYGWDLKHYLLHEFQYDLPIALFEQEFDEEDQMTYSVFGKELRNIFDFDWAVRSYSEIPIWDEILTKNNPRDTLKGTIEKIVDFWRKQNIGKPGLPKEVIDEFVFHSQIPIPEDFAFFYSQVDGMGIDLMRDEDKSGFSIFSMQDLVLQELTVPLPEEYNKLNVAVQFAGYLQNSWCYYYLTNRDQPTPEYAILMMSDDVNWRIIKGGLRGFLELYIIDSDELF